MISQLIQNTTETLSTSNGMVFQIILATILFIGPAFIAAAIVLIWPLGKSTKALGPTETETDSEGTSGTESGVILHFRRRLPHLEADVPADIAIVSPHADRKAPVQKLEKRTSNRNS